MGSSVWCITRSSWTAPPSRPTSFRRKNSRALKFESLIFACLAVAVFFVSGAGQPKANAEGAPASVRFVRYDAGLPTSGQWREGFRIADMNGDGHPDIVHGPARKQSGPPVIFLGDGKGSWSPWKAARFPALAYDYGDVEVADFNRDGHLDIALAVHLHGFFVLTGDGHGNFQNSSVGLESSAGGDPGFSSRAIRAVDWNGDGLPDLVAVSEGLGSGGSRPLAERDGVVVFLNQGAKGWRKSERALSKGIYSDSITLGDFDGDGHIDIATGSSVMDRGDLVNLWRADGTAAPLEFPGVHQCVRAVVAGDIGHSGEHAYRVGSVLLRHGILHLSLV